MDRFSNAGPISMASFACTGFRVAEKFRSIAVGALRFGPHILRTMMSKRLENFPVKCEYPSIGKTDADNGKLEAIFCTATSEVWGRYFNSSYLLADFLA